MLKPIFRWPLLLLSAFLLLSGCNKIRFNEEVQTEGATPGIRVTDKRLPHARLLFNTVSIIDPNLQRRIPNEERDKLSVRNKNYTGRIAVENQGGRRSSTGTLEVYVVLRNRTTEPIQIEARSTFFDAQRLPIDGPTAWRRLYLPQNSFATYKELSTRVQASNYLIEVREGR